MTRRHRRALAGLAFAGILALAGGWYLYQHPAKGPLVDSEVAAPIPGEGTPDAGPAASGEAAVRKPEPAAATPDAPTPSPVPTLLVELPELERRLASGDFAAGWLAHRQLRACHFRSTAAASAAARAAEANQPWQVKEVEQLQSWQDGQSRRYCAGSETTAARKAFDLLLRMAEMGDLRAQVQFTLDPPIFRRQALAELDLILIYRERAPALLERALRAGSRHALTALLDAHTPALQRIEQDISTMYYSPSARVSPAAGAPGYRARFSATITYRELPHRQILEPDPATAYRLALICQRACVHSNHLDRANRTIAAVEGGLDAATRLRLSSEANALLLDAFARPVEEAPVTEGYWWNAQ